MKIEKIKYRESSGFTYFKWKMLLSICFLILSISSRAQVKPEKFVIRVYGFYDWDDQERIADSIREKWNIHHKLVAGCVVTDAFVDSVEALNDITFQRLENFYGKDWKLRLDNEIDSSYNLFLVKQENTYKTISECSNEDFSITYQSNLTGNIKVIDISANNFKKQKKSKVTVQGNHNKNANIVYQGYVNKLAIGFTMTEKSTTFRIKCNGTLQLTDSCIESNKIYFDYYPRESIDTLFIEQSNGDTLQHLLYRKILSAPGLTINKHPLDTVFPKKHLKEMNQLGFELDQEILLDVSYEVLSWELVLKDKSYKGTGNKIPVEVSKELKKLESGSIVYLYSTIRSSDSVTRKKTVSFRLE